MPAPPQTAISFARLPDIAPDEIIAHMSDPRLAEHMPLLTFEWTPDTVAEFVKAKEAHWQRDGLGHWALLNHGRYVGWGGFQREGEDWDFGLVLRPDTFGLGLSITRQAIDFARADDRLAFVTFLLPPSRRNLGALKRIGARYIEDVEQDGARFRKFRLDTS